MKNVKLLIKILWFSLLTTLGFNIRAQTWDYTSSLYTAQMVISGDNLTYSINGPMGVPVGGPGEIPGGLSGGATGQGNWLMGANLGVITAVNGGFDIQVNIDGTDGNFIEQLNLGSGGDSVYFAEYGQPTVSLRAASGTWVDPPRATAAPELDLGRAAVALTLLGGIALILKSRVSPPLRQFQSLGGTEAPQAVAKGSAGAG
jgi:hypothetical protein